MGGTASPHRLFSVMEATDCKSSQDMFEDSDNVDLNAALAIVEEGEVRASSCAPDDEVVESGHDPQEGEGQRTEEVAPPQHCSSRSSRAHSSGDMQPVPLESNQSSVPCGQGRAPKRRRQEEMEAESAAAAKRAQLERDMVPNRDTFMIYESTRLMREVFADVAYGALAHINLEAHLGRKTLEWPDRFIALFNKREPTPDWVRRFVCFLLVNDAPIATICAYFDNNLPSDYTTLLREMVTVMKRVHQEGNVAAALGFKSLHMESGRIMPVDFDKLFE